MTCLSQPRSLPSFVQSQRPTARTAGILQHTGAGSRTGVAAPHLSRSAAVWQRRTVCKAEGGEGGEGEQQQQTKLAEDLSQKTAETVDESEKTLGFVGNFIMWSVLAVLMGASLFFTTARSFMENDMQPLDENIASQMR